MMQGAGWRRYRREILHWSMEIVVVVIGVLVALAVQQWAEDRTSRQREADAEQRIRVELIDNTQNLIERLAVYPCISARDTYLRDRLADPSDKSPFTDMGIIPPGKRPRIYGAPVRGMVAEAFHGALNSGALAAMPLARLNSLAGVYANFEKFDRLNAEESELAFRLAPLQLGMPHDGSERDTLYATVARLTAVNHLMHSISSQQLDAIIDTGFALKPADFREWRDQAKLARSFYGPCFDVRVIARVGKKTNDQF